VTRFLILSYMHCCLRGIRYRDVWRHFSLSAIFSNPWWYLISSHCTHVQSSRHKSGATWAQGFVSHRSRARARTHAHTPAEYQSGQTPTSPWQEMKHSLIRLSKQQQWQNNHNELNKLDNTNSCVTQDTKWVTLDPNSPATTQLNATHIHTY
jgi:hypothetical protein